MPNRATRIFKRLTISVLLAYISPHSVRNAPIIRSFDGLTLSNGEVRMKNGDSKSEIPFGILSPGLKIISIIFFMPGSK